MKKTLTIISGIILTSIVTISCESKKENQKENQKNEISVELNNGEKWFANIETTDGIKNMQLILNDFSDTKSTEAYTNLEESLKVEFANIFSKCTMTGESHNQLHNFLKPMLKYFDGLNSGDLKICQKNYDILNEHLKEYSKYFE